MRAAALSWMGVTAALLLTAACGQSVVVDAAPEAPPYEGPLYIAVSAAPDDQEADRSGAAGQVVGCDTSPVGDSESSPYPNSVSRSPSAALKRWLDPSRGASNNLRESRREEDRVLYTYEVDRRVRQAMIVRRGPAIGGDTGWYVESWARCDWAEMPPEFAERLGIQVWTDTAGQRIPTRRLESSRGPEHCDWEDMTFLSIDGGDLSGGQTYLEHPQLSLYPDFLTIRYSEGAELPADAEDTGYLRDGRHLWLASDQSRAFVGTLDSVAIWPRTVQPLGCA